MPSTHKKKTMK